MPFGASVTTLGVVNTTNAVYGPSDSMGVCVGHHWGPQHKGIIAMNFQHKVVGVWPLEYLGPLILPDSLVIPYGHP